MPIQRTWNRFELDGISSRHSDLSGHTHRTIRTPGTAPILPVYPERHSAGARFSSAQIQSIAGRVALSSVRRSHESSVRLSCHRGYLMRKCSASAGAGVSMATAG